MKEQQTRLEAVPGVKQCSTELVYIAAGLQHMRLDHHLFIATDTTA